MAEASASSSLDDLLDSLDLARLPTVDEIKADVESRFLAPRQVLKDDWLGGFAM